MLWGYLHEKATLCLYLCPRGSLLERQQNGFYYGLQASTMPAIHAPNTIQNHKFLRASISISTVRIVGHSVDPHQSGENTDWKWNCVRVLLHVELQHRKEETMRMLDQIQQQERMLNTR